MGRIAFLVIWALVCAAAGYFVPAPWNYLPVAGLGALCLTRWYLKPNRLCAAAGAEFLEAEREEAFSRAEAIARRHRRMAATARRGRNHLVYQGDDMYCRALSGQEKWHQAEIVARELIEHFERSKLRPDEFRPPQRTLAHILIRQGKIDEAEALLRRLQESDLVRGYPLQRGAILSDLAALESERGRHDRAMEWNTRAIHMLETHAAAQRDLAILYMNRGGNYSHLREHPAALADYQIAIHAMERIDPDSSSLALLRSNAGVAEMELGQLDRAVAQFRKSIDLWQKIATPWDPRVAMTNHNLAEALLRQGNAKEAMFFAMRSLEVKGAEAHPHYAAFRETFEAIRAAQDRPAA
jgi:tetratricopeptide (TPR) repeat protein